MMWDSQPLLRGRRGYQWHPRVSSYSSEMALGSQSTTVPILLIKKKKKDIESFVQSQEFMNNHVRIKPGGSQPELCPLRKKKSRGAGG